MSSGGYFTTPNNRPATLLSTTAFVMDTMPRLCWITAQIKSEAVNDFKRYSKRGCRGGFVCRYSGFGVPTASDRFSPSENRGIRMDYEVRDKGLGEVARDYSLWTSKQVEKPYASDIPQFRRDFGQAMFKLSHLQVFKEGEVRLNCRKAN